MVAKLFKKIPDADRRSSRCEIRLNAAEEGAIKHAAEIRNLSVAEYIRRAALGRRADVRYDMEIVLQLSLVVQSIRAMHADLVVRGMAPTAEGFRPVIQDAREAMRRIEK